MDFSLTTDQLLLRDSAARFIERGYDFNQYLKSISHDGHWDPAIWAQFADFGWLGLCVSEANGGVGGSVLDAMLVAQALGSALVTEPYLAGALIPLKLLEHLSSGKLRATYIDAIVGGKQQMALAYQDKDQTASPRSCSATYRLVAGEYIVNGSKTAVLNAPNASHIIVSAREEGRAPSEAQEDLSLFVVPLNQNGVTLTSYPLLGGGVAAEITLQSVSCPMNLKIEGGIELLEEVLDFAAIVDSATVYGAMRASFKKTLNYVRTRTQFGIPLASNQAIQHRIAEMYSKMEQANSMILYAAMSFNLESNARKLAVSSAKVYVCDAVRLVSQQALQLHGGIGMTEELDIGHLFRQMTAYRLRYGDREFHLTRALHCDRLLQRIESPHQGIRKSQKSRPQSSVQPA